MIQYIYTCSRIRDVFISLQWLVNVWKNHPVLALQNIVIMFLKLVHYLPFCVESLADAVIERKKRKMWIYESFAKLQIYF